MNKKLSSSSISWNFGGETFHLLFDVWDVDKAKRIIRDKPRPIGELELEPFRKFISVPGKVVFLGVTVNWKKALSDGVDLTVPIIRAYGRTQLMPIDGWHRIAKALMKGLKTLPEVKLTKEESKLIHTYTRRVRTRRRVRRHR